MVATLPLGPRIGLWVMFVLCVPLPIALGVLDTGEARCVRNENVVHCECIESLHGLERSHRRVDDVTGARLDYVPAQKSKGTNRTVLLTRAGEVTLPAAFNHDPEEEAPSLAARVTTFLASSEPTMTFTLPGRGRLFVLCVSLFWLALKLALPRLTARASSTK